MITYMSLADIGAMFGVDRGTVSKWRSRYPDTPQPDAMISTVPGWLPQRTADWKKWHEGRNAR